MNISAKLNQTMVYWAPGAVDVNGNTAWDAPVEVACRWENKTDLVLGANGEKTVSMSRVYTLGTQAIALDGKVFLGTLSDLTAGEQANPDIVKTSYRVINTLVSPSIHADQSLRKVWL